VHFPVTRKGEHSWEIEKARRIRARVTDRKPRSWNSRKKSKRISSRKNPHNIDRLVISASFESRLLRRLGHN
jgi:hypothetical protein